MERADRWSALLKGEQVSLRTLVGDVPDEDLLLKTLNIWRRALENQEEKGLATMFVALGMATWKSSDGGRSSDAPILLLPVSLELKGHAGTSVSILRTGPIQVNLVLLQALETEFGVTIPQDKLTLLLQGSDEEETFDASPIHRLFKESCSSVPEFLIHRSAILGNFAFQKMAMVKDLQSGLDALTTNDIIAALAGDSDAKQSIGSRTLNPDPKEFDSIPPQTEFLILDADSSQQSAIAAVIGGQSGVVHGPPGTGKSQTISNLVANLAAQGKSVLFVAEKRAALQVVLKRLQHVGLETIAIDLHGADVSPKRVMEQVGAALNAVRQAKPVDCDQMHQKYVERRQRLNNHVQSIHRKRKPSELSVYDLQGALLHLQERVHTKTRWRAPELDRIQKAGPSLIRDLLREAGGMASLFLRHDPSPWNGAKIPTGGAAQQALDLAAKLSTQSWPDFLATLEETLSSIGFRFPTNLKEAKQSLSLLGAVRRTLESYSTSLFTENIQGLIRALAPAQRGSLRALITWATDSEYRGARKLVLKLRTAGKVRSRDLLTELSAAEDQRVKWAEISGRKSTPQSVPGFLEANGKLDSLSVDLNELLSILPAKQLESAPLAEIGTLIDSLFRDRLTPMKLPRLLEIERRLKDSGVEKLTAELKKENIANEDWEASFDQSWYASCLEAAQIADPELAGFNGRIHDGFVSEFKDLDNERIRVAAARVQRAYAERAIAAMNQFPAEELALRSEVEKKRRHRPLRSLFTEAKHVLTAVCPCWMASPLSVSQLLDTARSFDYVVFDEASQVLPEDAIPAIMRGSRLVVAGDNWQLPPTTFFAAADDDELVQDEENLATEGYESLLDATKAFMPSWHLDWHYRSRDESLISFSNHFIYSDRLVTFPGPGGSPAIRHVLVNQPTGIDGQEESSSEEVRKVVGLILEHAGARPNESLGVIALGIRHSDRIQRALDQILSSRPELANFFDTSAEERFFIKNLERVQGDERDAIILTIGYGKDRGGNLPFRFGPILSSGGRKRLNVAVTRARQHMTVVSSFSHLDMDPGKIRPGTGVELLRNYLEYAASGGKRLSDYSSDSFPMNSFEAEVFDSLQSKGMPLESQVGASKYRIDLVAKHPKQPGRFVLAIECDGASYHSSPTARDRDRLRQQQLESLGWKFHRIWSTDWFMRKEDEITRALAAYENAVAYADDSDRQKSASSQFRNEEVTPVRQNRAMNRGPRPNVPHKETITSYSEGELVALINWIESDGCLRSDEELIEELLPELGFQRRGARIDGTLMSLLSKRRSAQNLRT